MVRRPLSLRVLTSLVVLVMGALCVTLALVTGETYHRLSLDSQRKGLSELMGLAVDEAMEHLRDKSQTLGLSVQSDPDFERLRKAGDFAGIDRLLADQFHQYFVTAGEMRLLQLRLYDPEFKLLAGSDGAGAHAFASPGCPELITSASQRKGPERLQSLWMLCANPQPVHSFLVPVGGLMLRGYLEVVTDPAPNLRSLEKTLGMPLRLRAPSGDELYRSTSWPLESSRDSALAVDYALDGAAGHKVLLLTMLSDVSALHAKLGETRTIVLLVATVLTVIVAMLLHRLLQATMLEPIAGLLKRLQDPAGGRNARGALPTRAIRELHALQNVYEALDLLAMTDPLTQLPNRAGFQHHLQRHTTGDSRRNAGFALLIMDLNGFKQVNDRHGHHAGDDLLQQVATRLTRAKRRDDVLARLGGDEFAMILPGVDGRETAASVAEKIAATLGAPFHLGAETCEIGVSIGVAFYPATSVDPEQLCQLADVAMYAAKKGGRTYAFSELASEPVA
jgi:diguanylate cyclase (GGDEF)-like protein